VVRLVRQCSKCHRFPFFTSPKKKANNNKRPQQPRHRMQSLDSNSSAASSSTTSSVGTKLTSAIDGMNAMRSVEQRAERSFAHAHRSLRALLATSPALQGGGGGAPALVHKLSRMANKFEAMSAGGPGWLRRTSGPVPPLHKALAHAVKASLPHLSAGDLKQYVQAGEVPLAGSLPLRESNPVQFVVRRRQRRAKSAGRGRRHTAAQLGAGCGHIAQRHPVGTPRRVPRARAPRSSPRTRPRPPRPRPKRPRARADDGDDSDDSGDDDGGAGSDVLRGGGRLGALTRPKRPTATQKRGARCSLTKLNERPSLLKLKASEQQQLKEERSSLLKLQAAAEEAAQTEAG
jgi:hypothetical protein